jgi:hypothetical protein
MVKYLCKKKELLCALKVGIQNSFLKDKCSWSSLQAIHAILGEPWRM